ncbi:MAG: super-infection exclusion protein B [Candidatus Paceibacterota bacterium]
MIEKLFAKIILIITTSTRMAFALGVASWFLIFISTETNNEVLASYSQWIEVFAYGASAWFASLLIYDMTKMTGPTIKSRYCKYALSKAVLNLSREEKACLYPFYKNKTSRYFFPRNYSIAHNLRNKGFLLYEKTVTYPGTRHKPNDYFHINQNVYDLIEQNPRFFQNEQGYYEERMEKDFAL